MIRVLIVDDSKLLQKFLFHLLISDPEIQVIGVAGSESEAIELTRLSKPDVITMNVNIEGVNGYETIRRIMEISPTPIVIVSGSLPVNDKANIFKSLDAGAIAIVHCPPGIEHPEFSVLRNDLIQTVKTVSKITITKLFQPCRSEQAEPFRLVHAHENYLTRIEIIAIGASTGGGMALQKIFSRLHPDLPVPVLVVQHIAAGFSRALKEWLSITSGIKLKLAVDGETLSAGTGYIAPDHFHMGISSGRKIRLTSIPVNNSQDNSINYLFKSVAQNIGGNAFGVLLTGTGTDGAEQLKVMKEKGAITMVQNEESSLVYEMPLEAIRIGAADLVLSLEGIADILSKSGSKKVFYD
jgi:two-component system chemotaxis response regulator CheB